MKITRAAIHDLIAVKNNQLNINHSALFADQAYCDQFNKQQLAKKNNILHTPIKLSKSKKTLPVMKKFILNLLAQLDNQSKSYSTA
ncbi:MAG: hypothetical protein K2X69_07095 [Silvanigrellaceae bacterium]|jgi:hypothetical protein|nr:hypothetical protein [Silvanigrellaceae bacterium]